MILLATLIFAAAFSLLYASKMMSQKPAVVDKLVSKIGENLETLSYWGVIYGLIAAFITPIFYQDAYDILSGMFAAAMVVLMALPYSFEKITSKIGKNINPAVIESLRDMHVGIVKFEKIIGNLGIAAAVLLFAVMLR